MTKTDAEIEREDAILAFADRVVAAMGVDPHDVEAWTLVKTTFLADLRATMAVPEGDECPTCGQEWFVPPYYYG